jgi:hypothetical protein
VSTTTRAATTRHQVLPVCGAGELARELGDAGGLALVGTFGPVSLALGFAAIAAALGACTALVLPRTSRRRTEVEDPSGT